MTLLVSCPVITPPNPDVLASWNHRPHVIHINGEHDRWHNVAGEHHIAEVRHRGNRGVARSWNEAFDLAHRTGYTHVALMSQHLRLEGGTARLAQLVTERADDRGLLTDFAWHCIVLTVDLWLRVGRFDEGFTPAYYEDSDYVRRMFLAGVHTPAAPMPKVGWDLLGGTEQNAMTLKAGLIDPSVYGRNAQRFRDKWGGDPFRERWSIPWDPTSTSADPDNWTRADTALGKGQA